MTAHQFEPDEDDLERIRARAAGIFTPDVLDSWMHGPNDYLGGRPIDVLEVRGPDGLGDVLDALDVAEQKAWGG